MKGIKRILAVGLSACMLFSMTACGKTEDAASGGAGPDMKSGKSIETANMSAETFLSEISPITEGKFELSMTQDDKPVTMDGRFKGSDFSIDTMTSVNAADNSTQTLKNVAVASDGKLYFDFGAVMGSVSSDQPMVFSLPMPDVNDDKINSVRQSGTKFISGMLSECATDFMTADENSFTIEINRSEDMKKFINGYMDYIIAHESDFQNVMTDFKGAVNFDTWLDKIIDDCADDLAAASGTDDVESIKDSLKENVKSSIKVDTSSFDDLAKSVKESKEKFNAMTDEEYDKSIGNDSSFKISFRKDNDAYVIDFDINIKPRKDAELEDSSDAVITESHDTLPSVTSATKAGHISGTIKIVKSDIDTIAAPAESQSIGTLLSMFMTTMSQSVDDEDTSMPEESSDIDASEYDSTDDNVKAD
jgi:hypothetical protein